MKKLSFPPPGFVVLSSALNVILEADPMKDFYLLYDTTTHEEPLLPSNESFFIKFNFSYTYFLLETE
jgi:hypothetical protein